MYSILVSGLDVEWLTRPRNDRQLDLFMGPSFDTISSTGPNGGERYLVYACFPSGRFLREILLSDHTL